MIKRTKGLFTYTFDDKSGVEVKKPDGSFLFLVPRNPSTGLEWSKEDAIEYASIEVDRLNKELAIESIDKLVTTLSEVYNNSLVSTVTLSDKNVFGPAKSIGENPTYSLQNTLDLIKNGCEYALMRGLPSITLSDANNKNVVYTFDLKAKNPIYILPVVELADYIVKAFAVKQAMRNNFNLLKESEDIDLDKIEDMNVSEQFNTLMKQ